MQAMSSRCSGACRLSQRSACRPAYRYSACRPVPDAPFSAARAARDSAAGRAARDRCSRAARDTGREGGWERSREGGREGGPEHPHLLPPPAQPATVPSSRLLCLLRGSGPVRAMRRRSVFGRAVRYSALSCTAPSEPTHPLPSRSAASPATLVRRDAGDVRAGGTRPATRGTMTRRAEGLVRGWGWSSTEALGCQVTNLASRVTRSRQS